MRNYLGMVLAITLLSLAVHAEPPHIKVTPTQSPPVIDGKLEDACWKEAAKVGEFFLVGTHKPPLAPTEAWLTTDGVWLYIAFRCQDGSPPERLVNKEKLRDGAVNADDSVEVFIDPGTKGDHYLHFLLNVGNVQADQLVVRGNRKREWDASWRSAVFIPPEVIRSEGWSAEIALPLYIFRQHMWGDVWRINLCRNKRTPPTEYSSWAPVEGGFHEPQSFGFADGLKEILPGAIFAPLITSSAVSRYTIVDGMYSYDIFGELMNDGGRAGTVELIAEDQTPAGECARAAEKFTLAPLEKKAFRLRLQIVQPGDRMASLILRNPQTGEIINQINVPGLEALNPLRAYLDRNYYTNETKTRVLCQVAMDEAERKAVGLYIVASLVGEGGKVLATSRLLPTEDETAVELPLQGLTHGVYQVYVELRDRSNTMLGVVGLVLTKHPSATAGVNEVKIDQENRCLLLNGKPFFPVGICATQMDTDWMRLYHEAGFNTLIRWWGIGRDTPVEKAIETLNEARRHGILIVDSPLCFLHKRLNHQGLLVPEGMAQAVKDIPDFLRVVRYHPSLLAYYGLDEAPGSGPLEEPLRAFLRTVHEHDPYHPVYISGGEALLKGRYDFADILGGHIYWCPLGAEGANTPNTMAQGVQDLYQRITEPNHRPLFIIPQLEITSWSRRPHTPPERRINVYLALIHGAKSIIYFVSPINHRATFESVKELSAELHALAPALLTKRPPQEIIVEPAPPNSDLPVIQALLKDRPEGGAILLAGNCSNSPVKAKWDFSALGRVKVSDFFGKKNFEMKDGILTDSIAGFGTRAYLITGGSRRPYEKATIRLALEGLPPASTPTIQQPTPLNLLRNPNLEAGPTWTTQDKGVSLALEGRAGTRCLKISKAKAQAGVNITFETITLKPNTRYRFGGWVRSNLSEGRSSGSFYLEAQLEKAAKRWGLGLPTPPTHGEWKMLSREFTTPDEPVQAKFWYQVAFGIVGDVWLDDLFVEEMPAKPKEALPKNRLLNSSFEEAGLPGWPDSWFFGTVKPGQLIGEPGGPGQDFSVAYHGKCSLKIVNPFNFASGFANARYIHKFTSGDLRGGVPVEQGKTYVFSVYLRAEKEGTPAQITLCNFAGNSPIYNEGAHKRLRVSTKWERYQVACTIPTEGWTKSLRPEVCVFIYNHGIQCAIWADAAQLEEGTQATEYME